MRIKRIRLRNFKRFTDLVIKDIPDTADLVVVVGPNGSGKSSLFDALLNWYRMGTGFGWTGDLPYFQKSASDNFDISQSVEVETLSGSHPHRGCLYIRTAYRNDPDLNVGGISRLSIPTEQLRIGRAIENDQAVSENFQRLVYETMASVYDASNDAKSVRTLRDELIGDVRNSMKSVFGDLLLNNISDPLGSGSFFFEKGASKSYHYKNLSGGEKSAFDLLLDMHMKRKYFSDAIYCIDEVETHLHTRVQGTLLRELVRILPRGSQLWVTTHSLGVLRAAQEMSVTDPGSVCVIDFDSVDPDIPHEIMPSNLGRLSWEKMLSIAIDDLSLRVAPKYIVVCEGSSTGNRRKDFDAEIYNRILGSDIPDIVFVSGGSSSQLSSANVSVSHTLSNILPSAKIVSLCDRDDKSDAEVDDFERSGDLVLARRNIESYLFDDEVIEALLRSVGKEQMLSEALGIKQKALTASATRGNAPDDVKSAAGQIYVDLKRLLGLQRCGNNSDTFMRDTLAPLINRDMTVYRDLKSAIVDKLP